MKPTLGNLMLCILVAMLFGIILMALSPRGTPEPPCTGNRPDIHLYAKWEFIDGVQYRVCKICGWRKSQ